MTKEYVQQYARLEKEHWWFLIRRKIIINFINKHLPRNPGHELRILNIGAAAGGSTEFLSSLGAVTSVENEPLFIKYLNEKGMTVTEASVTQLPFADESFDLVCAFDVIEHVANDSLAMQEMTRVCKTGGSVCLTVPAFNSLWSNHDVINGHERRYTKKTLELLFRKLPGLSIIETRFFNSILFVPIFLARKFSNMLRRNNTKELSDFDHFKTSDSLNRLLKFIFGLELSLMKLFHFPFGVSLISFLKKN